MYCNRVIYSYFNMLGGKNMQVSGCCNVFSVGISTLIGLILGLLFLISTAPMVFLSAVICLVVSSVILLLLVFIITSAYNHRTIIVITAMGEFGICILFSAIVTWITSLLLILLPVSINTFFWFLIVIDATAACFMSIVFIWTIYRFMRLCGHQ